MTMALNLLLIDDTSVYESAMYPGIRKGGGGSDGCFPSYRLGQTWSLLIKTCHE